MVISLVENYRESISKALKELRSKRSLTQAKLAAALGISQAWLSTIENGKGSLTAEQLLAILDQFGIPLDALRNKKTSVESELQKSLRNLGAHHLRDAAGLVSRSDDLETLISVTKDVLVSAKSSRHITSLAPVILDHADPSTLNKLRLEFLQLGLAHRWGWTLDNTLDAIRHELYDSHTVVDLSWVRPYRKAEFVIKQILDFPKFLIDGLPSTFEDTLETDVTNEKSLKELRASSSDISKKWHILSRIQPNDFLESLREARGLA